RPRPPTLPPFPYTTLFRSRLWLARRARGEHAGRDLFRVDGGHLEGGGDAIFVIRKRGARQVDLRLVVVRHVVRVRREFAHRPDQDRKSTRLNSSHRTISYA